MFSSVWKVVLHQHLFDGESSQLPAKDTSATKFDLFQLSFCRSSFMHYSILLISSSDSRQNADNHLAHFTIYANSVIKSARPRQGVKFLYRSNNIGSIAARGASFFTMIAYLPPPSCAADPMSIIIPDFKFYGQSDSAAKPLILSDSVSMIQTRSGYHE